MSLEQVPTEQLFEILDGDLELAQKGEDDAWGEVEYKAMRDVLAEIKRRVS